MEKQATEKLPVIQKEIVRLLKRKESSYAAPVNSYQLGASLNASPAYIREQAKKLERKGIISVRRGPGGGYYLYQGWD